MPGGSKKGGGLEVGSAYKMKGSPMHRNFGIGTPLKAAVPGVEVTEGATSIGSLAGFKQYIGIKKYKPTKHVSISDKISKNLSRLFSKSKDKNKDKKKVANTITEKVKETTERVTGKSSKKKETKT